MTPPLSAWRRRRSEILLECGAPPEVLAELLEYNERPFDRTGGTGSEAVPLSDEPQMAVWGEYVDEARAVGVAAALRRRFPQLRFPIRDGISQDPLYRRATLQGVPLPAVPAGPELELCDPDGLDLALRPTLAGRIPILTVRDRADFVSLVRAFACRNEPAPVPEAMGACVVAGLPNWDRIARHRAAWSAGGGEDWGAEFKRLAARKDLYQDRFIILSSGPYSGVPAAAAGLEESHWRRRSLVIRREHECTHYLMRRVLGSMKNNLQDEVVADFAGLVHAFGRYRGDLALSFFGLERYPEYRTGGRLENYLGQPPLSDLAAEVVRTLVFRTVENLEQGWGEPPASPHREEAIARTALLLGELSLEELACSEIVERARERPLAYART